MLSDTQYAMKQLRGIDLFAVPYKTADRIRRAVDALERLEEAARAEESRVLRLADRSKDMNALMIEEERILSMELPKPE